MYFFRSTPLLLLLSVLLVDSAPTPNLGCPPKSIRGVNGRRCFTVVPVRMNFEDAKTVCEVFEGKIAVKWSREDEQNLRSVALSLFGKADLKTSRAWSDDCTVIDLNTGRKESVKCTKTFPFICESAPKHLSSPSSKVPSGWTQPSQFIYKVQKERLTWDQAKEKCERENALLVTIQDASENEFLADYGLKAPTWSGGRVSKKGNFYWYTHEKVKYHNLEDDQSLDKKTCIAIVNGNWQPKSCDDRLPYICKRKID
ncbi:hypothetical protein QR680_009725 [Steinernema hermaphroditum]|uniref:C-type lectin domain-containing protein n=1 Tax=Steinernema hermaphroditum TaxID=289476 RepID=A0AA39IMR0_9BILA|nr:hypothetical protein QR680_009725 [Steinernema hermaphroditum]